MAAKRESPAAALVAGTTAGAIEAFITYPTEFVKTRSQFTADKSGPRDSPIKIIKDTLRTKGVKGLYSGCGALVVGNAAKAGVRFVSYDQFKHLLADTQGKVSAPRSLLGAPCRPSESFGLTISNSGARGGYDGGYLCGNTFRDNQMVANVQIRTKLIEDSKKLTPQYRGLAHGTMAIVRAEGITGIYRGLFPVMMRQGANSAIRFTSYSMLKQLVQSNARPGQTLPSSLTFGIGAVAGLITVYTTMPLDVIKTRMQSLNARTEYRNAFHCAYRIFTEEGILRFWAGTTPRLARLVMSGGIVFTVYEKMIVLLGGRAV